MSKNIDYTDYLNSEISIPTYSNRPKFEKFLNFLKNNISSADQWMTCNKDLDALVVNDNKISIDFDKCIGCLSCILANTKHIKLDEQLQNRLFSNLFENYDETLVELEDFRNIFSGKRILLPEYTSFHRKFSSFEEFTTVDEVKHIAIWMLIALKFLSSSKDCRIGREIEIFQSENPRDGRLDVCVLSNSYVLVVETKTSFSDLMIENRYRLQIPRYVSECQKILDRYNKEFKKDLKLIVLLGIGGNETDLYPPSHPDCTSTVGDKSKKFYNDLIRHNIRFVSANALWVMSLYSILTNSLIFWDELFPKIFARTNSIGLLTSGLVVDKNGKFVVEPIYDLIH